ncbi:uncharacterized protein LOC135502389 [Lineus longissimus]|uniref:uncharacterized protein LOC135502389 n=1 Tax=Lineus longissimus TaxID=88925 RepID=UPI00315CF221
MGQASTGLKVQYSPRIDPEAKLKYDAVGKMGKEASLELFIVAKPTPAATGYVWEKHGNILANSSPDYEIQSGPTFSKLKIKNVKSSDYTFYTCSVKTSAFHTKVFKFRLLGAGPPSAPRHLKVVNSSAVAATLEWISGFNGGSEQRFYIQYKKSAEKWPTSEGPEGGITDPGLNKLVSYGLMDLESNAVYVFRVRSKNSNSGPHTSKFSNNAFGKTPEKPQTSLLGVSRKGNKVTVRWKQVTGIYTALKIKYCLTGTKDCMDYAVLKSEDVNMATFFVDAFTYYYYMIVQDGGDVVYRSTDINDEYPDESNSPVVADKTNIVVAGVVGGLVGAVIVAIAGVMVAAVLWKRGLVRWGKRQDQRPANDTVDFEESRVTPRNDSAQTFADIGGDNVIKTFHHERAAGHKTALPIVTERHMPAHGLPGNQSASSDDDLNEYEIICSTSRQQAGIAGQNPMGKLRQPRWRTAESGLDATRQKHVPARLGRSRKRVDTSSNKVVRRQEPEGTNNGHTQRKPCQSPTEGGSRQVDGTKTLSPSSSIDDVAYDQESPCAHPDLEETEYDEDDIYISELSRVRMSSIEDEAAYYSVNGSTTCQQGDTGQNPVPVSQADREYAVPSEIKQRGPESEYTYIQSDLPILTQGLPIQCMAKAGSREFNGKNKSSPSRSSDVVTHGQEPPYANLDQVERVKDGEYLDFHI